MYSKATANLEPIPFHGTPSVAQTLEFVNKNLNTSFNSVLVNKYHNKNTALNWHKDNEPEVDQSEAIATMSIGAERRFLTADSLEDANKGIYYSTPLAENSVFTMNAGFQETHVHKIDCGRAKAECGVRYSLTFRRLLSVANNTTLQHTPNNSNSDDSAVDVPLEEEEKKEKKKKRYHSDCYQVLVVGSSLTKGLDEGLLSKRSKRVKVISRPGARVATIAKTFTDIIDNESICLNCVQDVFVVCGGNDMENVNSEAAYQNVLSSFNSLTSIISDNFLYAVINVFSLIPRRLTDAQHLSRILRFNDDIMHNCLAFDFNYIDIFSHFIVHKKRFYSKGIMVLNEKLYVGDKLHFSSIGNSVLAKVIIGVTYNPY